MNTYRKSYIYKVICVYLSFYLILPNFGSLKIYALTSGPSQPEFNAFTPVSTSDMVNLSTGDFNYNIPLMDVGGYPINIAYDSGITMDQEASWVGLGWNLNVGQINRQVRGLPDDFKGDELIYENKMRDNKTFGVNVNVNAAFFGVDKVSPRVGVGLGVEHNNYEGISFHPSASISYSLNNTISGSLSVGSSTAGGVTVSPNVSFSHQKKFRDNLFIDQTNSLGVGISANSRQGLSSFNLTASSGVSQNQIINGISKSNQYVTRDFSASSSASFGSSISFINNTYTPSKRVAYENNSFSFNGGIGFATFGVEGDVRLRGYGSKQSIKVEEENKIEKAFGYEHTEKNDNGILDFNREKDRGFNKNTTILPVTNYTYDIYSINGQGIGGMFRPFRSQVSHVYDKRITDDGSGSSFGAEVGVGAYFHGGVDVKFTSSTNTTGLWENSNYAKSRFDESKNKKTVLDYEPVYFKMVGELNVDKEANEILEQQLMGDAPIKIGIGGSKFNRIAKKEFVAKDLKSNKNNISTPIYSKIDRKSRQQRNTSIQKITVRDAYEHKGFIKVNSFAKQHHTAGVKILKDNGSMYVYGETAYNKNKVEATFAVNSKGDCSTGLVGYTAGVENTKSNESGIDHFYNKITTPSYAHTYLLTSVLSSDYEDLTGDGPTDDDLGSYTKFSYSQKENNYKWRVPYQKDMASFNEGLTSLNKDQKGNYLFGEKELLYIDKIETKTHIAKFHLSEREDARGVVDENGGGGSTSGHMYKIDKISLYSKPDYKNNGENAIPIKEVHFKYDYSLVPNVPNNLNEGGGKLTLKSLYFTYQNSKMGRYTPYKFNYDQKDENGNPFNPDYNLKGNDIWGNYKENSTIDCSVNGEATTAEFPFVEQDKAEADINVTAWTLSSIDLPSGGNLELDYESDDYQFVQNRRAMQMFKVIGVGKLNEPLEVGKTRLFDRTSHADYLYVKIDDKYLGKEQLFEKDYIGDLKDNPIYFRFFLNMVKNTSWQYDYVSGYFFIDDNKSLNVFSSNYNGETITCAAIPMKSLKKEGGWVTSNQSVNPISKSGWYFGRKYLNRVVYSLGGDAVNDNFESIMKDLVSSIAGVVEIFKGPNDRLQQKGCAREFKPEKSWIRLYNPDRKKLGGGARVKKLVMHDKWDEMTGNLSNPLYKQQYGQIYSYTKADGTSSGVATYEPNMSKENPLIVPFYDKRGNNRDQLVAPQEENFIEKPFGESFFPTPYVTYSRVEVKNLERTNEENTLTYNATGKVVNEFYTTYDFPTLTDYTDVTSNYDKDPLGSLLKINVRNHLTMSQGFVVRTNDMNGKMKSQWIYAEGKENPISGVEYHYNINDKNELVNTLATIDKTGKISDETIGVHYDAVNDFRENYSNFELIGANVNVNVFPLLFFPGVVVTVMPEYAKHENILRTAVTTKVIHSRGILKKKIAYDLGSKVSTENLAWDAETGRVLLTKTVNEYDDAYYNLSYPAHWYYENMGNASKNINISSTLKSINDQPYFIIEEEGKNPDDVLALGDEIYVKSKQNGTNNGLNEKLWVVDFKDIIVPIDTGSDEGSGVGSYRILKIFCEDPDNEGQGDTDSLVVLTLRDHDILEDGIYGVPYRVEQFNDRSLPCELSLASSNFLAKDLDEYMANGFPKNCGENSRVFLAGGYYCNPTVKTAGASAFTANYGRIFQFCEDEDYGLERNIPVVIIKGNPTLRDGLYKVNGSIQDYRNGSLPKNVGLRQSDFLANDINEYGIANPLSCRAYSYALYNDYNGVNPTINGGKPIDTKIVRGVMLMDKDGKVVNACSTNSSQFYESLKFKIVRSGFRNLQMANMASVTSMVNPIDVNNDGELDDSIANLYSNGGSDYRVVNSSAIEYSDVWRTQCERYFKGFNEADHFNSDGTIKNAEKLWFNPYLYNAKGDWRAKKSYAYLTGRKTVETTNPRNEGFFVNFNPFYKIIDNNWSKDKNKWTYASEVTQYSPYGVEVENKDALGRYSSAQYGYNYTLPTAVASNSSYKEMGFDGFEDYTYNKKVGPGSQSFKNSHFGYEASIGGNITINSNHSHTGRNSIAVASNSSVTLEKQLFECLDPTPHECTPDELRLIVTTVKDVCNTNSNLVDCDGEYTFDLTTIPDGETLTLNFDYLLNANVLKKGDDQIDEKLIEVFYSLLKNGVLISEENVFTDPIHTNRKKEDSFSVQVTNTDTLKLSIGAFASGGITSDAEGLGVAKVKLVSIESSIRSVQASKSNFIISTN